MPVNKQDIERYMLECSICMEFYDDNGRQPRILPCQHTFCVSCLNKILANGKIVCSQCRNVNNIPDIDKLPKDNVRRDLMDILRRDGKPSQTCTMCEEGNVAVSFCQACQELMCEECTKAHRRMKVTSKHDLTDLKPITSQSISDKSDTKQPARMGHENKCFCMTCDKIVEKCMEGHVVVNIEMAYDDKQRDIRQMVSKLETKMNESGICKANEDTVNENDSYICIREKLQRQFKVYQELLKNREEKLLSQLNEQHAQNQKMLNQRVDDLNHFESEANNAISLAERICNDADKAGFLEAFKSSKHDLLRLCDLEVISPDIQQLVFTEACTTDDFKRIIEALGCFRTASGVPNNYVVSSEPISSIGGNSCNNTQSIQALVTSLESHQSDQLMEVLKSIQLSGHLYLPSSTTWSHRSEEESAIPVLSSAVAQAHRETSIPKNFDQFKVKVTETGVPKGRAELLKYPETRAVILARFQTHMLKGDFDVVEDGVVIYANSVDEADYCKQLMQDSIFEKRVTVRPEAMILVHSDKWLDIYRTQCQKYPNQITIDIVHDENKISVYSTSSVYLQDAHDAVTIFFRDNDLKIIYLKFSANIVTLLMKQKTLLKKVLTSWSHFCVDITKHDDVTVQVKGIGIGLANAVRSVHELAGKCTSSLEEDDARFDDDDDDDDNDDTRFDDVPVGNANVELKLKGVKADLRSVSLIGNDKVVYVFHGDVIELPAEVIVNPADKNLKHNGGLAKVLVKKGGKCIQDECRDFVNQHGEVQVGEVMCSSAGTLQSQLIIHAVGPKWIDGQHNEETQLGTAVYNSLVEAHKHMLISVTIPAVGAGTFGFPLKMAAKCIVGAIRRFFLAKPVSCIREVYLVDISPHTAACFTEAVREAYVDGDHVVSSEPEHTQTRPVLLL